MFITIIAFIVVLSVLVLIHELGHYLTAKKFGIKVEEFGFGFPPRVLGKKIGETIYSINLLPVGGFVKLYGEDAAGGGSVKTAKVSKEKWNTKKAFFARPAWQRATIILAGVVMNFVLAVVLISYLFTFHGVAVPTENIKVVEVVANSPASTAGLKKDDLVISVNSNNINDTDSFVSLTRKSEGKPLVFEIKRNGQVFTKTITPRTKFPKGEGPLGVAISNIEIKKYPWYEAPFFGTVEAFKFSWLIVKGLLDMVVNLATGKGFAGVAGPIGVAQLTGQAVSYGFDATLWFVALLSLNLAVVNVLPIPALDGGRLFFIVIEMITGKKVDSKYETMAHAIGLVVLLGLIVLITFFDIMRLVSGQSILPKM
ncbi:MAG TPA: RIP metalloprotease RseP [Patescibacteria group bacterium]|nr:RIP metalloprotease RseP [Patescibacteria group bacterium]